MATHKLRYIVEGSGISVDKEISSTGTGVALIDGETVATAQTDFQINFDLDVSAVKSFFLVSSQNITLETNAIDATGGNTLALIADEPYVWHDSDLNSFLLTEDVTTTYWTNASGATATIYCVALFDATPS